MPYWQKSKPQDPQTAQPAKPAATPAAHTKSSALIDAHERDYGQLDGWLSKPARAAIAFLLEYQKAHYIKGHMMEIGVFHGLCATLMSLAADKNETGVFCDFQPPEGVPERLSAAHAGETIFLKKYSHKIIPSVDFPQLRRSFRFIHIDGGHSGTDLTLDLQMADAELDAKGIICIDDFYSPRYPQVTEATYQYLRQNPYRLSMFLCGEGKAFLGRPMHVNKYITAIGDGLPEYFIANGLPDMSLTKTTFANEINCFGLTDKASGGGRDRLAPDWDPENFHY